VARSTFFRLFDRPRRVIFQGWFFKVCCSPDIYLFLKAGWLAAGVIII